MRRLLTATLLASVLAPAALAATSQVFLSKVYTIDKKYKSMEGPGSIDQIYLGDPDNPELLWVTGIRTEMVGEDGVTPQLPELMCHVNVDLDPGRHSALLGLRRHTASRLITLSQGMIDAKLPKGFAYPLASNEPLSIYTQVLNLNIDNPSNLKVRHRITFDYIRDADLKEPVKPLFNVGASGTVILAGDDKGLPGMGLPTTPQAVESTEAHGTSCLIGSRAPNAVSGGGSDYTDAEGRKVTGHWIVPPGKQVNHSDITWFMQLPFDTKLHWAAAHLHPFAKSLAVRDTTTGELIFEVKAEGPKEGIGLTNVETFASENGVKIFKNHKYELVSVYDNTTKENADSMASAFMAMADHEFVKPQPGKLTERAAQYLEKSSDAIAIVRTSHGDFKVTFFREEAPSTVRSFIRLARSGAFNGARFARGAESIELRRTKALTEAQKASAMPFVHEPKGSHRPATLAICGNDPHSFSVNLAPRAAGETPCTAFGLVSSGTDVVRAIATGPAGELAPIEILRVDLYDGPRASQVTLAPAKTAETASGSAH